jgi:hypothetical protein
MGVSFLRTQERILLDRFCPILPGNHIADRTNQEDRKKESAPISSLPDIFFPFSYPLFILSLGSMNESF